MKKLFPLLLLTSILAGCKPEEPKNVDLTPKSDAAEKIAHGEKVNPSDVTPTK